MSSTTKDVEVSFTSLEKKRAYFGWIGTVTWKKSRAREMGKRPGAKAKSNSLRWTEN